MQVRLLRYLVTLAREQHFARAAAACSVTQPTLSAGIATLEEQLGKRLVQRDRRFIGLTDEGRAMLPWAQQLIAVADGMAQAVATAAGPLQGEVRLGVIPASMPVVGYLAQALETAHPYVTLSIRSLTSREIARELAAFELDGGLTYLNHEPSADVLNVPLYAERYVFVTRADGHASEVKAVQWEEALGQPLCLLHQGMQNRRILDTHLAARGLVLRSRVIADSYLALLALVRAGGFATIIPDSYAGLFAGERWAHLRPFAEPLPASRIGLVVLDRSPLGPLALALLGAARSLDLPAEFGSV
jgi:DNA-binding transcriptional LysR family regulator